MTSICVFRKIETTWRSNGEWKARYSKIYSSQRISLPKEVEPRRISFMSNESAPYATLLSRMRANSSTASVESPPSRLISVLSQRKDSYATRNDSNISDNWGGTETLLLDMVRSRNSEIQGEIRDKASELPHEDNISDEEPNEMCIHGLSMRTTERSISRSRMSRMSTRRDMDIPSILAFPTNITAPVQLEIPAFQKTPMIEKEKIPRWSIRRSLCPVCSQKWKDRSSIANVKNSGLKRNSSTELPSVIAPARLRTSITMGYVPRPVPAAVDKEAGVIHGGLRHTSTTWQLTRARRFRTPKLQIPPPEATAPPSCAAPLARKDLDLRVIRFLTENTDLKTEI